MNAERIRPIEMYISKTLSSYYYNFVCVMVAMTDKCNKIAYKFLYEKV